MSVNITDHPTFAQRIVKALGLPERTINFSLHFPLNDAVTVKCEYYPDAYVMDDNGDLVKLFKEFRLEEITEDKPDKDHGEKMLIAARFLLSDPCRHGRCALGNDCPCVAYHEADPKPDNYSIPCHEGCGCINGPEAVQ